MTMNRAELAVAVRNLHIMQQALAALQAQLRVENPGLLAVTAPSYERRIRTLKDQISARTKQVPRQIR